MIDRQTQAQESSHAQECFETPQTRLELQTRAEFHSFLSLF